MEMTFAQALTEARQVIVQQAARIKADAEKLKSQQQMLLDQGGMLADNDRRMKEQAHDLERQAEELRELNEKIREHGVAREQNEAVINRQGERITALQGTVAELERKVGEQIERISDLERERESLEERLPTKEDADALASMSALLTKKVSGKKIDASGHTLRIANEHAEAA